MRGGEIEKHLDKHLPGVKIACETCGVEIFESALEEHTQVSHDKQKQQCEMCPNTYTFNDQIKRHMWRAHTPTECSLCGIGVESRQDLKHNKENIHKVTKQIECKYAKEGNCIVGQECLYHHDVQRNLKKHKQQENKVEGNSNVKCMKCPKGYKTQFEVKRHERRSHEQVDCRLCGHVLESKN